MNHPNQNFQQPAPKGPSVLKIALGVLLAFVIIGFGSCVVCVGFAGKVAHDADKKQTEEKKQAAVEKAAAKAAPENVSLSDVLSAYKSNELKADKLYKGKYVKLTGIAGKVSKSIVGDGAYVTLGTGKKFEIPEVQCFFKADDSSFDDIEAGKTITVVGRIDGLLMNVALHDCELN